MLKCSSFTSLNLFSTTHTGMDDEDNETSPLHEMLDDKLRVVYFKRYLAAVAQAIKLSYFIISYSVSIPVE